MPDAEEGTCLLRHLIGHCETQKDGPYRPLAGLFLCSCIFRVPGTRSLQTF